MKTQLSLLFTLIQLWFASLVHGQCDPAHMWHFDLPNRIYDAPSRYWRGDVDLSGSFLAIGDRSWSRNNAWDGAAYTYEISFLGLMEHGPILHGPPTEQAQFAETVRIGDAGHLLIGARDDGRSGAVYVYVKMHGRWIQSERLVAATSVSADFGSAIETSGRWLAISAYRDDNDNGAYAGSVFIYELQDDRWVLDSHLIAPDGRGEYFGHAIALSDNTLAVGTLRSNRAYVFRYDGVSWASDAVLLSPSGRPSLHFGGSVTIADGDVLVGDAFSGMHEDGAVYAFRYADNEWTEIQRIKGDIPEPNIKFGGQLRGDGSRVLITSDEDLQSRDPGAIYVYGKDDERWTRTSKLASPERVGDDFPVAFDLSGDLAVAVDRQGRAHFYDLTSCTLSLALAGSCPGDLTATVGNARPGQIIAFVAGRYEGAIPVPGCRGLNISIGQPELLGEVQAGADGIAAIRLELGLEQCGRVLVQALDPDHCRFSRVVHVP